MELAHQFLGRYPNRLAAYLALECALMHHFIARGGTADEFVRRYARAFHRRYRWMVE